MSAVSLKVVSGKSADERQVRRVLGVDVTPVADTARLVWLASIGAAATAMDELGRLTGALLERGQAAQQGGLRLVTNAQEESKRTSRMAEEAVGQFWQGLLYRLSIPTRGDINRLDLPSKADLEVLGNRLVALTRQVEQLRVVEEPRAKDTGMLAAKVDALTKTVEELRGQQGPQARETEILAGKIGTLTQKVNELQKMEKERADEAVEKPETPSARKSSSKKS